MADPRLQQLAAAVSLAVAELPDRNSPADWPDAMLVTHEELHQIVLEAANAEGINTVMALINSPEVDNFLRGAHLEAVHQVDRWGTANDRAKRPANWFWLVGYLCGQALHAAIAGDHDNGSAPLHQHGRSALQLALRIQRPRRPHVPRPLGRS